MTTLWTTDVGEVTALVVDGSEAVPTWSAMRTKGDRWPLILGPEDGVYPLVEQATEDVPTRTSAVLSAAGSIDYARLTQRWRDENETLEDHSAEFDIIGEWPTTPQSGHTPVVPYRLDGVTPHKQVTIASLPVSEGWQAAAVLGWGAWNACPSAEEHVVVHRHWQQTFGAHVMSMTFDVIEHFVERPPTDRRSAMALAEEQFVYCPDIVEQGVGTIAALGAVLLDSPYWFFWWD